MTADHPGLTCAEAQELIDHYREKANETPRVDRSRFPAWLLRFVTNLGRPGTVDGPGTTHNQPRAGAGVVYHYDHCSLYDIFAHDYDDCPYNDDGSVKHDDGRANHPASRSDHITYRAAHVYDPACFNCTAGYVHVHYDHNDASAAHEHYDDDA